MQNLMSNQLSPRLLRGGGMIWCKCASQDCPTEIVSHLVDLLRIQVDCMKTNRIESSNPIRTESGVT